MFHLIKSWPSAQRISNYLPFAILPKEKFLWYEFVTCFSPNFSCLHSVSFFLKSGGFWSLVAKSSNPRRLKNLRLWLCQVLVGVIGTIKKVLSHKWSAGRKLRNWKLQLFPNFSPQMDLGHDFLFPRPVLHYQLLTSIKITFKHWIWLI